MAEVNVTINEDRISDLPKNLIESILERITTKEVARTSILSTKWRNNWTNMLVLVLDKQFSEGLTPNKRTESSQFVRIVDTILMVHNGPIHKLHIDIPFSQTSDMDIWILYLSRNGVKELTLSNCYHLELYKLSSYIFSSDQLTYLSLSKCVLNTPLQCTAFSNLTQLHLWRISLCTNTGSLISTLPALVTLFLCLCTGVQNINKLPPNLSEFVLFSSKEVQWQWFLSKTKISCLYIRLCKEVKNADVRGKIFKLNSLFLNMPNLCMLCLDGFALKFLAAGDFTEFPQLSLQLKEIRLFSLQFNDLDQVSCALCLLKSSPNLEKLEIEASLDLYDGIEQQGLSHLLSLADSDLKLNCLWSAKLRFFTGLKAKIAFVKLILSHSPVLQQNEIEGKDGMAADKELTILIQLTSFCRASVESKLIYASSQVN